jgi:hypothetical protein
MRKAIILAAMLGLTAPVLAADIGLVKVAKGSVHIERAGE